MVGEPFSKEDALMWQGSNDRGTLIASGLIAGGALFGVFAAVTIMLGKDAPVNGGEFLPQVLGVVAYLGIIAYLYFNARRAKKRIKSIYSRKLWLEVCTRRDTGTVDSAMPG